MHASYQNVNIAVVRCLYSKIYPLLSDTKLTSFLTNISMRGLRFESGPNAHYLANSVLPFSTPLAQAIAAVTDSILTVLARGKVAAATPERYCMGKPGEVWSRNLFESCDCIAFVPAENIIFNYF